MRATYARNSNDHNLSVSVFLLITDILFLLILYTFRKKLDLDDNHDEKKRFLLGAALPHRTH